MRPGRHSVSGAFSFPAVAALLCQTAAVRAAAAAAGAAAYRYNPAMLTGRLALFAAAAVLAGIVTTVPAAAQDFTAAHLIIAGNWSRPTPPGAAVGVAYLTIMNTGALPDRLIGASTPISAQAQLHATRDVGGTMQMRRVSVLLLPPGKTVLIAPGGLHIMLLGLKKPLIGGTRFPLTLRFEHAGSLTVEITVRAAPHRID